MHTVSFHTCAQSLPLLQRLTTSPQLLCALSCSHLGFLWGDLWPFPQVTQIIYSNHSSKPSSNASSFPTILQTPTLPSPHFAPPGLFLRVTCVTSCAPEGQDCLHSDLHSSIPVWVLAWSKRSLNIGFHSWSTDRCLLSEMGSIVSMLSGHLPPLGFLIPSERPTGPNNWQLLA